jgi:GNAT superfamily N-acetyltransferase
MNIRTGTVAEAVALARRMPDFSNPYNLNSPDTPLPELDHVLIAEEDGDPVGFRAGRRHSADTFAVWLAGVLPEYRRQGIAGALYRRQKDWLKTQGYRFLRTHVRNSNRAMLKILVDKGYQIVDVVRYGDLGRNKIILVKNLWPSDAEMTAGPLIVGLLKTPPTAEGRELHAWLGDITISWLRFKYAGRVIEDSSVDAILERASQAGHKYCLILTHGTIVSHAWELGMVATIANWADQHPLLAAGEILHAPDTCPGVSPQGLLVNLQTYKQLGQPQFGQPATEPIEVSLPQAEPQSDQGQAAPPTLEPSGRRGQCRPSLPGWNLVSAGLAAGIAVRRLPDNVAATLQQVAPQNNEQAAVLQQLRGEGIATHSLDPAVLGDGQFKFLSAVQRQVRNSRRGIFVWNFESYDDVNTPPPDFQRPIGTLYSVAAGLKTSWILATHGFDDATRLVYFDYSPQALHFKKMLHEEWNGEDYPDFLRYLFQRIGPGEAFYQLWGGFSPQDVGAGQLREAWTREIGRWGSEAAIKEHWQRTKNLRVDYVLCNIITDQQPLVDQLDDRPGSIIWWSNVFFTFYSNWFYSIDQRRAIYERFLGSLTERSPHILIYGNDYNNIPVTAIGARQYAQIYFQTDENCLEPRRIHS